MSLQLSHFYTHPGLTDIVIQVLSQLDGILLVKYWNVSGGWRKYGIVDEFIYADLMMTPQWKDVTDKIMLIPTIRP